MTRTTARTRSLRRGAATLVASVMVAGSLALVGAAPAQAAEREFRYAGAEVEFEVDKDDGRFEVEVDIDDARPGEKFRIVVWQNGQRFHKKVHTADRDGEIEIDKTRRDTKGRDVFKLKIKKIGGPKAVTSVIRTR
jgi:hypothetical protein